jgi:hypothetical protein
MELITSPNAPFDISVNGTPVLKEDATLWEAEEYIMEQLDQAVTEGDWTYYWNVVNVWNDLEVTYGTTLPQ